MEGYSYRFVSKNGEILATASGFEDINQMILHVMDCPLWVAMGWESLEIKGPNIESTD